jgi:putative PIN family toxin of toxin-antitoxin system
VFLDTNVLVSAFATRGLCADLFEVILARHAFVTGTQVLWELSRVLRTKLRLPPERADAIRDFIVRHAVQVVETSSPVQAALEPDDARVLGEALAGEARVFVTGDAMVLAVGAVGDLAIMSPREFWAYLREG